MAEILAPADDSTPSVKINCRAVLPKGTYISKKIIIEGEVASGALLDCQGGKIIPLTSKGPKYTVSIRSVLNKDGSFSRPSDVTVKNCQISGSLRVYGMAAVASEELRQSSYSLGHTKRSQDAAPIRTTLFNLTISGTGSTPIYLSPGVTYTTLENSDIKGKASSVAIYLDAESAHNTIKNNKIHVDTLSREQMAIDGSAHNKIINNYFSGLSTGGIFLYRNCGERGVVRHQTPQHNQIINNVFYYDKYNGPLPAIWLGSRNNFWYKVKNFFGGGYCEEDDGYNFGSSKSNNDYAHYNVVAENQFYKRSLNSVINDQNGNNYILQNSTVASSNDVVKRRAGCFVHLGYLFFPAGDRTIFSKDLSSIVFPDVKHPGHGFRLTCNDNQFEKSSSLPSSTHHFECSIEGKNSECKRTFKCPLGKQLLSLASVCNLEVAKINSENLTPDSMVVERPSDHVSEGFCKTYNNIKYLSISKNQTSLIPLLYSTNEVTVSCQEHDKNGGDCFVKAEAACL